MDGSCKLGCLVVATRLGPDKSSLEGQKNLERALSPTPPPTEIITVATATMSTKFLKATGTASIILGSLRLSADVGHFPRFVERTVLLWLGHNSSCTMQGYAYYCEPLLAGMRPALVSSLAP